MFEWTGGSVGDLVYRLLWYNTLWKKQAPKRGMRCGHCREEQVLLPGETNKGLIVEDLQLENWRITQKASAVMHTYHKLNTRMKNSHIFVNLTDQPCVYCQMDLPLGERAHGYSYLKRGWFSTLFSF